MEIGTACIPVAAPLQPIRPRNDGTLQYLHLLITPRLPKQTRIPGAVPKLDGEGQRNTRRGGQPRIAEIGNPIDAMARTLSNVEHHCEGGIDQWGEWDNNTCRSGGGAAIPIPIPALLGSDVCILRALDCLL